ncbi:unnamed protein product [Amoebophrya sp. A25]|nr:unnamed protein product [Amoebophrya sp. A25]|eukprot:GSA25T00026184001.1
MTLVAYLKQYIFIADHAKSSRSTHSIMGGHDKLLRFFSPTHRNEYSYGAYLSYSLEKNNVKKAQADRVEMY